MDNLKFDDHQPNQRLIDLLNERINNPADEIKARIIEELNTGSEDVLLPSNLGMGGVISDMLFNTHETSYEFLHHEGKRYLLIFTDWEAYLKVANEANVLFLQTKDVLSTAAENRVDGVIINIDSPNMYAFSVNIKGFYGF